MEEKKPEPKDPIFIFNNSWFALRTLIVPSPKEDGFFGDYYKYEDGSFRLRIGQLMFFTKKKEGNHLS